MRKTFKLTHPKIKPARLVEGAKNDVRKNLKRERKKSLPEGADFWGFDCKYGQTAEGAETIHVAEIDQYINEAESQALESFYLEVLAKPEKRTKKPLPVEDEEKAEEDAESV
ncbi:MAG: hypothetical protein HOA22_06215 [Gammaproteobacteria bacterium]|nr:hypothetical protein [Gammaproteobacteria bacterium]